MRDKSCCFFRNGVVAALSAVLLFAAGAVSAEYVCGFDGESWLIGYDQDEKEIWDEGLVVADYQNFPPFYTEIPQPFDANNDGVNDTGMRLPWRSNITPAGVYATTNNNTHAGSAPVWGGWEWIAYNTNTIAGVIQTNSNERFFCVRGLTHTSGHYSDFFAYDTRYHPGGTSRSGFSGEVAGLTVLKTSKRTQAGADSEFNLKTHNTSNNGSMYMRFALEIAPPGADDPTGYEMYLSDFTFRGNSNVSPKLVMDKNTKFWKYDPYTKLRFDIVTADGPYYPPFSNVVGAGYHWQTDVTAGVSDAIQRIAIRIFSFNAVTHPTLLLIR